MKEKQEKIEKAAFKEAERRDNRVGFIVTLVTSILLGLMFIVDLVFFVMGAIEWYIFLILLAIYVIVFPCAIYLMARFRRSVRAAEQAEAKAAAERLREELIADIESGALPDGLEEKPSPEKIPDFLSQYDE